MKSNLNLRKHLSANKKILSSKSKDKTNFMKWIKNNRSRMRKRHRKMMIKTRERRTLIRRMKKTRKIRIYLKIEKIAKLIPIRLKQ